MASRQITDQVYECHALEVACSNQLTARILHVDEEG
jgi:hypothetical protein